MAKMEVNMWKSGSSGGGSAYENGLPGEKANTSGRGGNVSSSASSADSQVGGSASSAAAGGATGPDPEKLKAILDRTNYSHQVTVGQRKYGGPPPDWTAPAPVSGCEIFVGHIPKDVYEDELIPLFEKIGPIWDLRLMIDPLTSLSRGYGFITYTNKEDAQKAVQELNGTKLRAKSYSLKVNISVPNVRLFIGNIPKIMSKEQIFNEFNKITEGLTEVITYSSPDDRKKNRGFCFLEFDSHKNASAAKRKLTSNGMKIFKCDILVDWADPQEEPDEETMSKVKVLYVRNLTSDVTESQLKELFEEYGTIERVKKIKDYAFVHFEDREQALTAMEKLNGRDFVGSNIEISLAKPPSDRRKKEEILRNRERRMYAMMQQKQYNMMAFPHRVPPSTIRAPMPAIPPPPPILPVRNGGGGGRNSSNSSSNHGHHHSGGGSGHGHHHRFSHQPPHLNPMMGGPMAFNRQGQPWNPLLHFYDPADWWYSGGGGGGGAGHHSGRQGGGGHHGGGHHNATGAPHPYPSFPGMPPPGSQWNAYLPNGQVPLNYGGGPGGSDHRSGGDRRGGHHHHGGRSGLNGSNQSNPNHHNLPYRCEYSKSARAKCKKCKETIEKDVLRLARIVPSPFHDGLLPNWFHYECFFEKGFSPAGTEEFAAFEHIRFEDQKRLQASIEKVKNRPSTSTGSGRASKGGAKRKAEELNLDGEFTVEYAKSGRSKCKLCEEAIATQDIRIGKKDYESSDAVRFGPLFRWFHVACFVNAREELEFFWDADKMPNFKSLEAKDKRELKKKLKAIEGGSKPAQTAKVEEAKEEVNGVDSKKVKKEAAKEEAKLKKQSDQMFAYIEKLKALRRAELMHLFEANDIDFIPDDSNKRLEILSDALTFGRPENCPSCGGYLRFKVSRYECRGNLTEWEKCSYETETPKRRPFIIPESLKKSYAFLKEYKGKTGTRVAMTKLKHNMQERKKQQLAQLVNVKDEEDGGDASLVGTSKPLDGYIVATIGGKMPDVSGKIVQFGGKVMTGRTINRSVAFVVSIAKIFNTSKSKMVTECEEHKVPVVTDAVFDLLHQGQGLAKALLQSEIALWDQSEAQLEERLANLNVKSKIKETFKRGSGSKVKKLGVNKLISKGGAVVDAESGLEDRAHILKEGDSFYSAVLNFVDVAKNKNSYYKLQILESDHSRGSYWVFRSWGRIGCSGECKTEEYKSKEQAISDFCKLYTEKTNNYWENRKNFHKHPGFYFPVDVDYGELDTKLDVAVSTSTLPDPVKYLISLIFDVARMKQTMLEFELDLDKMPLGKLSKAQLLEACSTLKELAVLLESEAGGANQASLAKMQAATNKFYSLVPHNFGAQCPPLIKSSAQIAAKMQMLDSLMDIELAYDIMKQEKEEEGQAVDPIDAHYQKLNAHIEPLDRASKEFELIQTYLRNTHAATHSAYTLEIQHVFKVERAGEAERFEKHRSNENRMLLWHGSRLTNFPGILSQGLRIAPPEAPVCGYMFGKGVYFADSVSKSANYCCSSPHSNEGLMLLSEVAIGKSQELRDAKFVTSLPKKYSSVKGIGETAPDPSAMHVMEDGVKVPLGKMVRQLRDKPSSLLYNEYIVYNEEQIKLRYLLNVKFNYNNDY